MLTILAIAAGGALGSVLRYLLNNMATALTATPAGAHFPWGIMLINIAGSCVMGVLVGLMAYVWEPSPEIKLFLTAGVLGGFTTFSTFSLDAVYLLQRGAVGPAALYVGGSVGLGIIALYARDATGAGDQRMSDDRTISVLAEDDGQRLDRWLKKRVPELPYGLAQKLIRKGAIRVDGKKVDMDARLAAGQDVRLPPLEDKPERKKTERAPSPGDPALIRNMVIFDDGDIVVLNKPAGIASQGGGGVEKHIDGLLEYLADKKGRRPKLIHRLDRDTSGVLLCARSPDAVRQLGMAFRDRQARKIYWAIVVPAPDEQDGTINAPIAKSKGIHKDRMVVDEGPDGKDAVTDFVVMDRAHKRAAFVAFMPRTGRTHQIRIHTADVLGSPILGDGKYGGAAARLDGIEISPRLHLHARRLTLYHPARREIMDFTAPLPPELSDSFKTLGFDWGEADARLADYSSFGKAGS